MEAAGVLSSTFALGILLHAAQSSFYSAIHGHYKTLFLHRRRLILLAFLLSASLLALSQFVVLLLLDDIPCQIAVIFSTTFDQLTRISAYAFVISKIVEETQYRNERYMLWAALGLRGVVAGVVIGFTRTQFIPVCFARPLTPGPNYAQLGMDAIIILYFLLRIPGLFRLFLDSGVAGVRASEQKSQGYGLFLIVCTFLGWFFGGLGLYFNQWSIFVRIVPLALALTLAIAVMRLFPSIVYSISKKDKAVPPYRMRRLDSSSPIAATSGARISPSTTPMTSRRPADIENPLTPPTALRAGSPRIGGPGNIFGNIMGAPMQAKSAMNVHPGEPLPWSLDDGTMRTNKTMGTMDTMTSRSSRYLSGLSRASVALVSDGKKTLMETLFPTHAGGKSQISGPMSTSEGPAVQSATGASGVAVKTISLKEAAENQRRKREMENEREGERERDFKTPKSAPIPAEVDVRNMERSMSVKRKALDRTGSSASDTPSLPNSRPGSRQANSSGLPNNPRSGVSGNPSENLNRISEYTNVSADTDYSSRFSQVFPIALQPAPQGPVPALPSLPANPRRNSGNNQQIYKVSHIEYDNPAFVASIMGDEFGAPMHPKQRPQSQQSHKSQPSLSRPVSTSSNPRRSLRNSGLRRRSPLGSSRLTILTPLKEGNELPTPSPPPLTPVLQRKLPKRRTIDGRALFPYEPVTPTKNHNGRNSRGVSMLPPQLPPPTIPLPLPPMEAPEAKFKNENVEEMDMNMEVEYFEEKNTFGASSFQFPLPPVDIIRAPAPSPTPVPETLEEVFNEKEALNTPPQIPSKSARRSSIPNIFVEPHSSTESSPQDDQAYATAKAWIAALSSGRQLSAPSIIDIGSKSEKRLSMISEASSVYSQGIKSEGKRSSLRSNPRYSFVAANYNLDNGIRVTVNSAPSSESEAELTDSDGEYSESDGSILSSDLGSPRHEDVIIEQQISQTMGGIELELVEERRREEPIVLRSPLNFEQEHQRPISVLFAQVPSRRFHLGDLIPTFSSRYEAGTKRKAPPSPIGFLMRQRRVESIQNHEIRESLKPTAADAEIDKRLTILKNRIRSGGVEVEDLLKEIPRLRRERRRRTLDRRESMQSEAPSETNRQSLLAHLEEEMDGQEKKWEQMQDNIRNSIGSESVTTTTTGRLSSIYHRSSMLMKALDEEAQISIDATVSSESTDSRENAADWQMRVKEHQEEYFDAEAGRWRQGSLQQSEISRFSSASEMSIAQPQPQHGVFMNANVNMFFEAAEEEILKEQMVSPAVEEETEFEDSEGEDELPHFPEPPARLEVPAANVEVDDLEYFSPLPPTVYNPNAPTFFTQILSTISPASPVYSPYQAPPSLLWNPIPQTFNIPLAGLWNFYLPTLPTSTPPAINIRPKARRQAPALQITSFTLWSAPVKQLVALEASERGLWKGTSVSLAKKSLTTAIATTPRTREQKRPKSILIVKRAGDEKRKSAKKVVFSPDVWEAAINYNNDSASLMSALKDAIDTTERRKSILASPDAVEIKKYGERPLPPVPTASTVASTESEFANETTESSRPNIVFDNLLWTHPTPNKDTTVYSEQQQLWGAPETFASFIFNSSSNGSSTRRAPLPTTTLVSLKSDTLWSQNLNWTTPHLWQSTTTSLLWPHGALENSSVPTASLWTAPPPSTHSKFRTNLNFGMTPSALLPNRASATARRPRSAEMPCSPSSNGLWQPSQKRQGPRIWLDETCIPALAISPTGSPAEDIPAPAPAAAPELHKTGGLPTASLDGLWTGHRAPLSAAASVALSELSSTLPTVAQLWAAGPTVLPRQAASASAITNSGEETLRRVRTHEHGLEIQSTELWSVHNHKKEKPSLWCSSRQGLWNSFDTTPLLADMNSAAASMSPMWSLQSPGISLFDNHPMESFRFVRPASKDPLPVFEHGLWTRSEDVATPAEMKELEGLWKPIEVARARLEKTLEDMNEDIKSVQTVKKNGLWEPVEREQKVEFVVGDLWSEDSPHMDGIFEHLERETIVSPRKIEELATLESDNLWTKEEVVPKKTISEGLWTPEVEETIQVDEAIQAVELVKGTEELSLWQPTPITSPVTVSAPLWHPSTASRTTTLAPLPFIATPRKDEEPLIPATGSLWSPTSVLKTKPSLWTRAAGWYTVGAFKTTPNAGLLWKMETASRTTTAMPEAFERVKKEFTEEAEVVEGPMWSLEQVSVEKPQLWSRGEKWYTVGAVKIAPKEGLMWTKETASRTTNMMPEPFVRAKQEFTEEAVTVDGPMWSLEATKPTTKPSLWTRGDKWYTVGAFNITPKEGPMWTAATASRTTTALPEPFTRVKQDFTEEAITVSGPMWSPTSAITAPKPSLWTKGEKWYTVGAFKIAPKAGPMWTAATASRTTSALPEPFVRPKQEFTEEAVTVSGPMWTATPEPTTQLWNLSFKKSVPGLWQSSIKENVESLWKRRSHAFAPAQLEQALNKRSSWIPKKVVRQEPEIKEVESELWRLVEQPSRRETERDEGLWNGVGVSLSPALSSTTTLSDVSEIETAPSSMTESMPVRIVRSNSDLSDMPATAGLWMKEISLPTKQSTDSLPFQTSLWTPALPSSRRHASILITPKPQRISSPLRPDNLPTFSPSTHSLWKPATPPPSYTETMAPYTSAFTHRPTSTYSDTTCSSPLSATSLDSFASFSTTLTEFSEASWTPELISTRRPAGLPQSDSPFATTLRVSSLRKKLRPVVVTEKREAPRSERVEAFRPRRHVTQSVIMRGRAGAEEERRGVEEAPVVPSRGWLWSKGIV